MNLPLLSQQELEILRQSIADHGVLCPVVRDKHGRMIDGHNRQRIAAELGVDCPLVTLDVEGEEADRLALELQVGRRNLDPRARDEYIAALRRAGMTQQAIADAVGMSQRGVGKVLETERLNRTGSNETGQSAAKSDIPPRVTTARGRRPATYNKRKPSPAIETVRKNNKETQLASMRNAPANKLNLPALRLAREIEGKLRELATLDPDKFLSQIPPNACRDFDPALAAYWSRWVELCKTRADTEELPERRQIPANGNMAAMPTSPIQERIIKVLRDAGGAGCTTDQLANILVMERSGITKACAQLAEMGLIGVDRRANRRPYVYRATIGLVSE